MRLGCLKELSTKVAYFRNEVLTCCICGQNAETQRKFISLVLYSFVN